MKKHVATICVLVGLFASFTSLHAQPIDDLIDQIVETAKQRTVRFDFTQRSMTGGAEVVGRGQGLYQAPGARINVRIETQNGEVETVILTDGQNLWHLINAESKAPRRVVIYDLASPRIARPPWTLSWHSAASVRERSPTWSRIGFGLPQWRVSPNPCRSSCAATAPEGEAQNSSWAGRTCFHEESKSLAPKGNLAHR